MTSFITHGLTSTRILKLQPNSVPPTEYACFYTSYLLLLNIKGSSALVGGKLKKDYANPQYSHSLEFEAFNITEMYIWTEKMSTDESIYTISDEG